MSAASPTWYDLLGVDSDASTDEVRAAWKAATADLDPGSRLDTLNRAAAVLLDPTARAEYDATLVAGPDTEPEAPAPAEEPVTEPRPFAPPPPRTESQT